MIITARRLGSGKGRWRQRAGEEVEENLVFPTGLDPEGQPDMVSALPWSEPVLSPLRAGL